MTSHEYNNTYCPEGNWGCNAQHKEICISCTTANTSEILNWINIDCIRMKRGCLPQCRWKQKTSGNIKMPFHFILQLLFNTQMNILYIIQHAFLVFSGPFLYTNKQSVGYCTVINKHMHVKHKHISIFSIMYQTAVNLWATYFDASFNPPLHYLCSVLL